MPVGGQGGLSDEEIERRKRSLRFDEKFARALKRPIADVKRKLNREIIDILKRALGDGPSNETGSDAG